MQKSIISSADFTPLVSKIPYLCFDNPMFRKGSTVTPQMLLDDKLNVLEWELKRGFITPEASVSSRWVIMGNNGECNAANDELGHQSNRKSTQDIAIELGVSQRTVQRTLATKSPEERERTLTAWRELITQVERVADSAKR